MNTKKNQDHSKKRRRKKRLKKLLKSIFRKLLFFSIIKKVLLIIRKYLAIASLAGTIGLKAKDQFYGHQDNSIQQNQEIVRDSVHFSMKAS